MRRRLLLRARSASLRNGTPDLPLAPAAVAAVWDDALLRPEVPARSPVLLVTGYTEESFITFRLSACLRRSPYTGCPGLVCLAVLGFFRLLRSEYLISSSYSRLMQHTSSHSAMPLISVLIDKTFKYCKKQNLKIKS